MFLVAVTMMTYGQTHERALWFQYQGIGLDNNNILWLFTGQQGGGVKKNFKLKIF